MTPEQRLLGRLGTAVSKRLIGRIVRALRKERPWEPTFQGNRWEELCVRVQREADSFVDFSSEVERLAHDELGHLNSNELALLWTQTSNGLDWCYDNFGSDSPEDIPASDVDVAAYIAQEVKTFAEDYTSTRIATLLDLDDLDA